MYFVVLLLLLSIPVRTPGAAFSAVLADTPPMGWNSWDGYGTTINEGDFKANADWLAKHLKPYGWEYVVVDADWFVTNPEHRPLRGHLPRWLPLPPTSQPSQTPPTRLMSAYRRNATLRWLPTRQKAGPQQLRRPSR